MSARAPFEPSGATGANPKHEATASNDEGPVLAFRAFVVLPRARRIICDGVDVELGGRTFDLLVVLLQGRGRVVCKGDIMRLVWPSTTVDDSNLRFQMAVLRKALGADRDVIKTIPGRGYMLADDFAVEPRPSPCKQDAGDGLGSSFGGSGIHARAGIGPNERAEPNDKHHSPSPADRISELERENFWLRLAVADLAMDRVQARGLGAACASAC